MKKYLFILYLGLVQQVFAQGVQDQVVWEQSTVHEGIVWKTLHSDAYFDSWQNINVLILESDNDALRYSFLSDQALRKTSDMAEQAGAAFAINGSFYNMKTGAPACFLKVNDTIQGINENNGQPTYLQNELDVAALAIPASGKLEIIRKPASGWESLHQYTHVMVSGPLLIWDGQINPQEERAFNTTRHPRSGVCLTKSDQIAFFTADGRNDQAAGLSTTEFAELMLSMDCWHSLNLDGGGSTTLWSAENGILNRPSDNKLFDQQGERSVANIVVVFLEQK